MTNLFHSSLDYTGKVMMSTQLNKSFVSCILLDLNAVKYYLNILHQYLMTAREILFHQYSLIENYLPNNDECIDILKSHTHSQIR